MEKLKGLKTSIREWNKNNLLREGCKKREIFCQIDIIDQKEEQGSITNVDIEERKRLKVELLQLTINEQRSLKSEM